MGKPSPSASSSSSSPSSPSSSSSSSADRARRDAGGGRRRRRSVPRDSPFQRSSTFRGVTRHRWTGRFEAHLWDKHCWNDAQTKKGKQVYLGAYDDEEAAAHAYDLAALKYWGPHTPLNFPVSNYQEELKEMSCLSREEYIGSLRRKSSGFSRGVSKYRGVARHHHNGRWEARIGRVFGNKYLYLGTYATQEEAATAYDMAAIEHRGLNAVTNFDLSRYAQLLKAGDGNGIGAHSGQPQPGGVSPDSGEPPAARSGTVESHAVGSGFPSASPESDAKPSCFPDDIQVYFEADTYTCGGVDDEAIFGELDSFLLSTFDFEDPVLA